MSFQLIVCYKQPADPAAFDEHYAGVHVPLAKRLPGLRSYTLVRPGEDDYHLVATLTWDDEPAFQAAMGSEAGKAAVADLPNFAGAGAVMLTGAAADA